MPPLPDFMTMKGPYINSAAGQGFRSILIYECDRSKLAEAMEIVADRLTRYFDVPGYTYSSNIWLEANEALKLVGLA